MMKFIDWAIFVWFRVSVILAVLKIVWDIPVSWGVIVIPIFIVLLTKVIGKLRFR